MVGASGLFVMCAVDGGQYRSHITGTGPCVVPLSTTVDAAGPTRSRALRALTSRTPASVFPCVVHHGAARAGEALGAPTIRSAGEEAD